MENKEFIKNNVFKTLKFDFKGNIDTFFYDGVKVIFDGKDLKIGCKNAPTFSRGLFEFAMNFKNEAFEIERKMHFERLGCMLDFSRNGVLKTESIKKYIDYMSALGFTYFCPYTEDTFEMKKYPRFGYLRGRYTLEELKEIEFYAKNLGMEVVPHINTLSHMGQYLKWDETADYRDTLNTLLVDEPKTYEFLEEEFKTMREAFSSEFIFIGCDEAHDLGTGQFKDLHGYEKPFDILMRHLKRVCDLAKKYDFKPVMASDMFFRLCAKSHQYYDLDVEITEDIKKLIPDVIIDYWDYYHTDKETYDKLINIHKEFGKDTLFAGSIWTWEGFSVDTEQTLITSIPAMQSCIDNDVKEVITCCWGDDGAECNSMQSINYLPIFSEFCYLGKDCSLDDIKRASFFLTKMPFENLENLSKIHSDYHDDYKFSKKYFYGDMFYNLVDIEIDYEKALKDITFAKEKAKEYMEKEDEFYDFYEYCYYYAKIVLRKFKIMNNLKREYEEKNLPYLRNLVDEEIPKLIKDYKKFHKLFKKDWLRDKKPNGLEVINVRIGGVTAQAKYVKERIESYLQGEITKIDELSYDLILTGHKNWKGSKSAVTPSSIL